MNDCEGRYRAPTTQWSTDLAGYTRSLDAVDFHINALRYRAGLDHNLTEEEQQLVRHAGRAVAEFLRGRHDDAPDAGADWLDTWAQDPNPAFVQAVAIELQWRRTADLMGRVLEES